MPERIRTFVAIDVPAQPVREILDELRDMGRPIRAAVEPLHLTLKFLGETDVASVVDVSRAVSTVASAHRAFDLPLRGIGAFPKIERPSVVWAGVVDEEPIAALVENLEIVLEPLRFLRETRPFHPHVTLARVKGRPPQQLRELLELYADETFGVVGVREVKFYQSQLTPAGPEYTVLHSALLGGDE